MAMIKADIDEIYCRNNALKSREWFCLCRQTDRRMADFKALSFKKPDFCRKKR